MGVRIGCPLTLPVSASILIYSYKVTPDTLPSQVSKHKTPPSPEKVRTQAAMPPRLKKHFPSLQLSQSSISSSEVEVAMPPGPRPKKHFPSLQPSQLSISSSEAEVEIVGSKNLQPSQLLISSSPEDEVEVGSKFIDVIKFKLELRNDIFWLT